MRAVWMRRYLGGGFRTTRRDSGDAVKSAAADLRRACPKPPYLYAKIGALRHLIRA